MLENPFKPTRPESDTDPAANADIVGKFLGAEAQAAYEKLDQGREGKKGDDMSDLTLTDAEKAVVKEAREKEVWDRAHYIRWAESLGKDEEWVDRTFVFSDDGSVECRNLDLQYITELHEFPHDLKISGSLDLTYLTTIEGLVLPASLEKLYLFSLQSGDALVLPLSLKVLDLSSLTTIEGLVLPASLETLYLASLQSAEGLVFPASLKVLWLPETLSAQVKELQEKGKIRKDISVRYS